MRQDGRQFFSVSRVAVGGGVMQPRYSIIENFFPEAELLRREVDAHFAEPYRHTPDRHQVWNYWFVPDTYTYLRTSPEKVVEPELARRFFDYLRQAAFDLWGLGKTTWPYLSLYVTGCHQGLHNDARGGRLGFVYSLTRWEERRFAGGETLLFREGPWDVELTIAKATQSFYELIPQNFNQLLVFDDRIPHAVPRIEGTMAPSEGRIVLHGHLSEAGVTIEGGLGVAEIKPAIAKPLTEALRRGEDAASRYHGLVVIRLVVKDGAVAKRQIPFDRVMLFQQGLPPFHSEELAELFADCRFPRSDNPTRITMPIAIGGAPV
jgi:hypothetical protein